VHIYINVTNKKTDNIITDNKKGKCRLTYVANSRDRNVIKKGTEKILKDKDLIIQIQRTWNVTNVIRVLSDDGNQLKIIYKISEQFTCKAPNQGRTSLSHIGHCTHTKKSTMCIQHGK
jgi:hypothetical protein